MHVSVQRYMTLYHTNVCTYVYLVHPYVELSLWYSYRVTDSSWLNRETELHEKAIEEIKIPFLQGGGSSSASGPPAKKPC
jgi:hypothetical protein